MRESNPKGAAPYNRLATIHYCEAAQHVAAILAQVPLAHRAEYAYSLGCLIAEMEQSLEDAKTALLTYGAMHSRSQGEA